MFSNDNNVYFSIFCEHRQLKHGIHVIDPSREVLSHCMTVQVGTWLQVVTSGYKWLQMVTSGYKWFYVVKSGVMWLSCFMWLKARPHWMRCVASRYNCCVLLSHWWSHQVRHLTRVSTQVHVAEMYTTRYYHILGRFSLLH